MTSEGLEDEAEAWDGHEFKLVSVPKILDIVRGRKPFQMAISDIKGGTRTSPGYSDERYLNTNTDYPIILDVENGLVDGRHRKLKLIDRGAKTCWVIKLTPTDIQAACK